MIATAGPVDEHGQVHAAQVGSGKRRRAHRCRQYVLQATGARSNPTQQLELLPGAASWDDYAMWHLGLTEGASEQTKAETRLRASVTSPSCIAAGYRLVYRASEWASQGRGASGPRPVRTPRPHRRNRVAAPAGRWMAQRGGRRCARQNAMTRDACSVIATVVAMTLGISACGGDGRLLGRRSNGGIHRRRHPGHHRRLRRGCDNDARRCGVHAAGRAA